MARLTNKTSSGTKSNTIEAVAAAAGVSTMTVSRVLRGTGNVAPKTCERVQAAMEKLGYVHNRLAGALASSHSAQIAVIVPSIRNIVFTEVLAGVTAALEGTDYQPVIGISDYQVQRELNLVRSMLAWRPAGFVLAHPSHHPETVQLLRASDVPVVELMEFLKTPIDMCIGLDHAAVGRTMARHLLSKGYRQFGYLGSDHNVDVTAAKRFKSFKSVIKRNGGEMLASITIPENSGISLGRQHMQQLIAEAPGMQAAYFSNDAVAAGAMMYCMANKIDIPRQLAIASFSGLEIAGAMPIPITTVKSPRYDMGRLGAAHVLRRLAGEQVNLHQKINFELIVGKST